MKKQTNKQTKIFTFYNDLHDKAHTQVYMYCYYNKRNESEVTQYVDIKLDFNLALNAPIDSNFNSDSSEFHIFTTKNVILNFPQFVLTLGRELALLEESLVLQL